MGGGGGGVGRERIQDENKRSRSEGQTNYDGAIFALVISDNATRFDFRFGNVNQI